MKAATIRRLACSVASALVVALPLMQADAIPLFPGQSFVPAPGEPDPVGGVPIATTGPVAWGPTLSFSGTLNSTVISGDASNPFGGLTFTYELTLDAASVHSASSISIGGFSSFLTDVSYQVPTINLPPIFASRSQEAPLVGQNVRFLYGPDLAPGQLSALLVVQTDSQNFEPSIASVLNSDAQADIPTLAPVTVIPEPTTIALSLLSLAGLGSVVFRKRINH